MARSAETSGRRGDLAPSIIALRERQGVGRGPVPGMTPSSGRRSLHPHLRIELPEVLRIHALEILLELVGLERGIGRRFVRLHAALFEQLVAGEDGSPHPE